MRKSTLLLLTLLLGFLPALAQQVVTGTVVTAPDNEAAIGASIIVKEHSKVGTTVGLDGSFKITVPAGSKTLRISYIGYLTQEVPIKDKMKITLEPSEKTLDKVVVTGLTKVDKRLFTGASAKLGGDKAKLDGVPDAARALLADGAWLKARAPEREQILDALAIGLGPADEQILEERLDDRAEAVRGRAAELLSRLPSSALIARAEALAERHVVVTRRALRAPAVELHDIEMTDALARDRYPAKAHRTSASLARLEEVIARIPTWRWPDLVGISAAELARARVRCDGQKADLIAPLVRAAVAWRDGELAAALADLNSSPAPAGLFGLLDEPRREALLHRLIAAKRYSAVVTCTLSWPSELTAEQSRVFARSLIAVTRPGSYISDSRWWGVLPARCAPEALDEVLDILRGAPPDTLSDLRAQTVITALELRRELLELTDRTDQEAS